MIPQMTEAEFYERLGEVEVTHMVEVRASAIRDGIKLVQRTRHLQPAEIDAIVQAMSKPDIENGKQSKNRLMVYSGKIPGSQFGGGHDL